MPRRRAIRHWTPAELKQLKQLAGTTGRAQIAKTLKRSPTAVAQRASKVGISLAVVRKKARVRRPAR
jgi:hypothetical protein